MAETRKRQRPSKPVPAVRKQARLTDVKTDPRMPDSWPNNSAVVRSPMLDGYVAYKREYGARDEDNPNLIGRIINDRSYIDPKYVAWRWFEGHYHWLGEYNKHHLAFDALSSTLSRPKRKRLKRTG